MVGDATDWLVTVSGAGVAIGTGVSVGVAVGGFPIFRVEFAIWAAESNPHEHGGGLGTSLRV